MRTPFYRIGVIFIGLMVALWCATLRAGSSNMRRVGELTLSLASGDVKGFYAACVDPINGFAYFGSEAVYKVDMRGPLPVQVGAGLSLGHLSPSAVMDISGGCAYFASGDSIYQVLANGTNPPSFGTNSPLFGLPGFVAQLLVDESDPANHYLYAMVDTSSTSSTFYKIALSQFPNASAIVGSASTTGAQMELYYGVMDLTNRYAYFGPLLTNNGPYLAKFALGNGATAPTNMGGVLFDNTGRSLGGMALDIANNCGYACSDGGDLAYGHARVYKFALNGSAPPSLLSYVDMQTNQGYCHVAIIKPQQRLLYFASDLDYPAKVFRFRLNPGTNAPVETGYLPLLNTTNAVVPAWGTNPTNQSNWGEVFAHSLAYDSVRDFVYIGRDSADEQTPPTNQIVKTALDRDEMVFSLITGATNGVNTSSYGDSFESDTNGFEIVNVPGWGADDGMMGVVTNYSYTNSYQGGFPIFGPHQSELAVDGVLTNSFAPSGFSNVWVDTILQCKYWTDPIFLTLSNTQFSICVTTNGHLAVWNCTNPPAAGNGWTELLDTSVASNQFARVTVQAVYNRDANGLFYFRVWLNGAPSSNPQTWYATADAAKNHFGNIVAQGCFLMDDLVVTSPTILITNILHSGSGNILLGCTGLPSFTHNISAANQIGPASSWQTIATNVSNPDGSWQFTDTNTSGHPTRYYRASLP